MATNKLTFFGTRKLYTVDKDKAHPAHVVSKPHRGSVVKRPLTPEERAFVNTGVAA